MDSLIACTSSVLISGSVDEILSRRPRAVKDLISKSFERNNLLIARHIFESGMVDNDYLKELGLLFIALQHKNVDALNLILERKELWSKSMTHESGKSALSFAIVNGSTSCALRLLDIGFDPEFGGLRESPSPLISAAKANDTALIKRLIACGVDVNLKDTVGRTALSYAAGTAVGVSLLLDAGASPDIPSNTGLTPLMVCCIEGFDKVVRLMARRSKNPNLCDSQGFTGLFHAATQGHREAVIALLEAGADPYIPDSEGSSVICNVIKRNQLGCLVTLLRDTVPSSKQKAVESVPNLRAFARGQRWHRQQPNQPLILEEAEQIEEDFRADEYRFRLLAQIRLQPEDRNRHVLHDRMMRLADRNMPFAFSNPIYAAIKAKNFKCACAIVYAGLQRQSLYSIYDENGAVQLELRILNRVEGDEVNFLNTIPWNLLAPYAVKCPQPLQIQCRQVIRETIAKRNEPSTRLSVLISKHLGDYLPPHLVDFVSLLKLELLVQESANDDVLFPFS